MMTPVSPAAAPWRRSSVPAAVMVGAVSGALVAAQSRLNGDLGAAGAGALVAGWLSYLGTLATVGLVVLLRGRAGVTARVLRRDGRWWWFAIGLCGIPVVIAMAAGIPMVGVAIASVCSVAGQTVSGLGLDARGIGLPAPLRLTGRRLLAGFAAVGGLVVAVLSGSELAVADPTAAVVAGLALFVAGAVLCGQQAGNGRVAAVAGDPVIAGLTTATGGTAGITLLVGVAAVAGGLDGVVLPDPAEGWYLYLGGPLGAAITIAAAWAVRHLGTFALTLAVVGGQMSAAVVIDVLGAVGLHWSTAVAVAMIAAATVLAVVPQPSRTR